jgi:hypothetical protein
MQIHEITFGPKKLNEGLLDTVKAAYTGGGVKGVAKAMTSPAAYARAQNTAALPQVEKLRQQLEKQYGINIQGSKKAATATGIPPTATSVPPAVSYKFTPPATPGVAAQTNVQPPSISNQILPRPGYVLKLINPSNNGVYFKDPNGIWYAPSQARGQPPQKITSQKSIDYLDHRVAGGEAKEIQNQAGKGI